MYVLTESYLKFLTQTSIQIIEYKNINNKIHVSIQSIPAITLCYEKTFKDIFFDPYIKQYFANIFNAINLTNVKQLTIHSNEMNDYINKTLVYYLKYMHSDYVLQNKQIINFLISNIINEHYKFTNSFNGHNIINSTQYELDLYSHIMNCYINDKDCNYYMTMSHFGKCQTL